MGPDEPRSALINPMNTISSGSAPFERTKSVATYTCAALCDAAMAKMVALPGVSRTRFGRDEANFDGRSCHWRRFGGIAISCSCR